MKLRYIHRWRNKCFAEQFFFDGYLLGVDVRNISQKDRFEPETEKLLNKYFSLKKAKSRRSIDKKKSKRNSKKNS